MSAAPKRKAAAPKRADIEAFLYHEVRLLDERRFEDWRALFLDDGYYWVPLRPEQTRPLAEPSIIYDDMAALDARIRRLRHPRAWAQIPPSRTVHFVANVAVLAPDKDAGPDDVDVSAAVQMVESRRGEQRLFAGLARYRLRACTGGLRIAFKRVDLVNCDAALPGLTIPF